jgi:hypothetical protein
MYYFAGLFFLKVTLCMTNLRVLVLCFSYFTDNSNIIRLLARSSEFGNNSFS